MDFEIIRKNCYSYFEKALYEETCDVILAEKEQKCIGTGIVFYYDSVPSKINLTGKNAYITGMYVEPEYRGRGVAKEILRRVISRVSGKGYKVIMLNASDMGRPLYEKVGFQEIHGGMILHY